MRRLFEASDADGWICKPLTRDKLIAAVTRFVTRRRAGSGSEPRPEPQVRASSSACSVLLVEDEPVITARIEGVAERDAAPSRPCPTATPRSISC